MATVICLSGKAGAGKDTVAKIMKDHLEGSGYRVLITHYADPLKTMCKEFFGWDGKKDRAGRALLQYVGTDVVRKKDPDFWVNYIIKVLSVFPNEWDFVLLPDARFPNEVERIKEAGYNTIHIQVHRKDLKTALTGKQLKHASETAMLGYGYDLVYQNDLPLDESSQPIARMTDEIVKRYCCKGAQNESN